MIGLIIGWVSLGVGAITVVVSKSSSLRLMGLMGVFIGTTQVTALRYHEHPFIPLVNDLKPGLVIRVDRVSQGRTYSMVSRFEDGPFVNAMLMQTLGYEVKEGACYVVTAGTPKAGHEHPTQELSEIACPN